MLRVVPVASSLADAQEVQNITAEVLRRLDAQRWTPRVVSNVEPGDRSPLAFVVTTGGTEQQVVQLAERWDGPVVLLAHPTHNSLPASLEILARLAQIGRRGRIVLARENDPTTRSFTDCVASMQARSSLHGKRLGVVGAPSDWLVASPAAQLPLREQWGVELVDVPMEHLVSAINSAAEGDARTALASWQDGACARREPSDRDLLDAARVSVALREIVRDHRLDACSVRCFDLVTGLRTTGCLALSQLIDTNIMAGCEGDVPSTLTMMWMHALTGQRPFMANPQDVCVDDNSLWLAHCTIARSLVRSYRLRSHFESSLGVGIEGELDDGPATLARVGGSALDRLFATDAEILGHEFLETRCRTQVRARLVEPVSSLLSHPLGNHHILVRGHHARTLRAYADLYLAPLPASA